MVNSSLEYGDVIFNNIKQNTTKILYFKTKCMTKNDAFVILLVY